MEIDLQKTEIVYYRKHESGGVTFEAGSEMVVPDVMADIGEIVYASGIPLLRSKTVSEGKMTISGSIQTQVLYVPDAASAIKKLELEIPFSYSLESPDAEDCLCTASVRIAFTDARALNPRKIAVRCELCAELCMYIEDRLDVGCALPPGCESVVCAKQETATADLVSSVHEKAFIVTDSFPLSGTQSEACELLGRNVSISVEDVKYVGTKMILKGIIQTDLIWRSEEEALCTEVFNSGFSQILEIGDLEQPSADFSITLTGAYFELLPFSGGSRTVSAELHILAQAVCSQRREIPYISDVYSNRHPIQAVFDTQKTLGAAEYEICRDSMRGVVDTPWSVRDVLCMTASAGLWSATESGYTCPINVRMLLRDESGALHGLVRSFAAKWNASPDSSVAEALREVSCEELTATPVQSGAEVRMLAAARILRSRCVRITPLESLKVDDASRIDLSSFPSVTVLPHKSGDLWQLAKCYHSTMGLIEEVNRENDTSVLLIPRAR